MNHQDSAHHIPTPVQDQQGAVTELLDARVPRPGLADLPLLIPIPRAAQLLGISRSAAYRCAVTGDLPVTHLGGRVYVNTAKLQVLLESA
jgi:hypothetical protein